MNLNVLQDIPDPQEHSFDAVLDWLNSRMAAIRATAFTPELVNTFAPVELKEPVSHPLGAEGSPWWRRFFLATLLADWACYERPVDRADYARLKYIMTSAYPYTRLWGCRLPDGQFTPVGYTAWYPVAKFVFEGVLGHKSEIADRGLILPLRFAPESSPYGYVFNVSVIKELINTRCSRRLSLAYLRDFLSRPKTNFLAIGVGAEPEKLFNIGKFVPAGSISVQGQPEALFVRYPVLKARRNDDDATCCFGRDKLF
jgi:hypothetical protein